MKDRVLAEDGPENRRLQIRLTEYEGNRLLDLRFWFFSRQNAEWQRSRKGIMLNKGNFTCTRDTLNRHQEEILDWLGIGYVPQHVEAYSLRQDQALLKNDASIEVGHSSACEPKSNAMFVVKHAGASCEISYNRSHPFVGAIEEHHAAEDIMAMLDELLAAYSQAKATLGDSPATDASILFDQLEHNWAQILKRRMKIKNSVQ
jgi:hypothetical protein